MNSHSVGVDLLSLHDNFSQYHTNGLLFDDIDVEQFHSRSFKRMLLHGGQYVIAFKSFLVYLADIVILILMFQPASRNSDGSKSNNSEFQELGSGSNPSSRTSPSDQINFTLPLSSDTRNYIILGSIIISFLLLFYDSYKAYWIIQSKDIGLTFCNSLSQRFYNLQSFSHFCFFSKIQKSYKKMDTMIFFVFFTLKGWKRVFLSEAIRKVLIFSSIVDIINVYRDNLNGLLDGNKIKVLLIVFTLFSFGLWLISVLQIGAALLIYFLTSSFRIKGNLKEYCVKKVDKRVGQLLQKYGKKSSIENLSRLQQAKNFESESKSVSSCISSSPSIVLNQRPTLPSMSFSPSRRNPNVLGMTYQSGHQVTPPSLSAYAPPSSNFNSIQNPRFLPNSSSGFVEDDNMSITSNLQQWPLIKGTSSVISSQHGSRSHGSNYR